MVSKSDCPFYAGSTITDPSLFVGRRDLLKILCDRLTGVQPTSINIVGRHRTGKSSLLLHFVNTYHQRIANADRFIVIYLSLQNAACETQERFYRAITQACLGNIPSGLTSEVQENIQTRLAELTWDQLKFNELIQFLKQQQLLPVLCIDNFEELLERKEQFPNNFYDNLRFLIDSNALMLILASREKLDDYSKKKQITSDFFNLFHCHDLNEGLTPSEAEELVALANSLGNALSSELQKHA
ncbi:MAG: ATP-binding protein [Snowella sp.]|nr:ATP-binding protein [Snowella sp.]